MKNHRFPLFSAAMLLVVVLNSCASLTGFQDGRTIGENAADLAVSFNGSSSPDFSGDESDIDLEYVFFPNLEFSGRYGVTNKIDVGMRLNTNLNLSVNSKFQLVGDAQSKTAFAVGLEAGTFGILSSLWNVQVPLYFSVHPNEQFSWYLSPRFIYQSFTISDDTQGANYLGGNTGFLIGKRHKFGFDIGVYNFTTNNSESTRLVQVGFGGRFKIADGK